MCSKQGGQVGVYLSWFVNMCSFTWILYSFFYFLVANDIETVRCAFCPVNCEEGTENQSFMFWIIKENNYASFNGFYMPFHKVIWNEEKHSPLILIGIDLEFRMELYIWAQECWRPILKFWWILVLVKTYMILVTRKRLYLLTPGWTLYWQ